MLLAGKMATFACWWKHKSDTATSPLLNCATFVLHSLGQGWVHNLSKSKPYLGCRRKEQDLNLNTNDSARTRLQGLIVFKTDSARVCAA
eukprot:1507147-Amphidinium_carterae.2